MEAPTLISASNNYLTQQLKVRADTREKVIFSPAIIEANDFFVLKLLVFHNRNYTPTLEPFGKIAGTNIRVTEVYKEASTPSIFSKAFSGNLVTQAMRSVGYFLGFFLLMIVIAMLVALIVWPFDVISKKRETQRKNEAIKRFKVETKDSKYTKEEINYVIDQYKQHGKSYLESIDKLLSDKDTLLALLKINEQGTEFRKRIRRELSSSIALDLLKEGVVVKNKGGYSVNERKRQALVELIQYAQ